MAKDDAGPMPLAERVEKERAYAFLQRPVAINGRNAELNGKKRQIICNGLPKRGSPCPNNLAFSLANCVTFYRRQQVRLRRGTGPHHRKGMHRNLRKAHRQGVHHRARRHQGAWGTDQAPWRKGGAAQVLGPGLPPGDAADRFVLLGDRALDRSP